MILKYLHRVGRKPSSKTFRVSALSKFRVSRVSTSRLLFLITYSIQHVYNQLFIHIDTLVKKDVYIMN